MSDMRIGGLASGMDIDGIVKDLMRAEKQPLNKMEQDRTWTEWKRDSYREVNKQLLEFDNMMLDMKYTKTYEPKEVISSDESVLKATGNSSASNGVYSIEVTQVANAAYKVSSGAVSGTSIDPTQPLSNEKANFSNWENNGSFTITTHEGDETFTIDETGSLNDLLKEITDSGIGIRAFYNESSDQVMIERTNVGDFQGGDEISFSGNTGFLTNTLKLDTEQGGQGAEFIYNNAITIKSDDNNYSLNGVDYEFQKQGTATLNVSNNVDQSVKKITEFIDKYNSIVENLNNKVKEKRYRDFPPLTQEQRDGMEEKEIELWEEKAKSGLLRSDNIVRNTLSDMRFSWYQEVETGGTYTQLTQIGISTGINFQNGGQLEIDEVKLKEALQEDPQAVRELFAGNEASGGEGILQKLEDTIATTRDSIRRKAGNINSTDESYTLGRQIKDMNDRMDSFQERLSMIEDRYWAQFGEMERAIQQMNSQSAYLMQQFG
ncbi:flagellar hook-associated protein 2 [Halobacillus litoralis]|uniref:flagellar hook-associated protein 2 n=1 Tax=Halobacillus litoralis TaxID=45668 RepID=UPI001CD61F8B|nr:flagellar hook-associated protein 2 [Halobacillus litoralis]MCA0971577.1 flagellar hook-associated protein 2 [Halobacillus litoralis]